MNKYRIIVRRIAPLGILLVLLVLSTGVLPWSASVSPMVQRVYAPSSIQGEVIPDEAFLEKSRPIIFTVNKTIVRGSDKEWLKDSLRIVLEAMGEDGILYIRSAASPEGPVPNNVRLAIGRAKAAMEYFSTFGIDTSHIVVDAVTEDYNLLLAMMKKQGDSDYDLLKSLWHENYNDYAKMKKIMRSYKYAYLWNRLYKEYFPELRAVRYIIARRSELWPEPEPEETFVQGTPGADIPTGTSVVARVFPPADEKVYSFPDMQIPIMLLPFDTLQAEPVRYIPLLNVRTNLLYDAFYLPPYGMTSMPNVGLEFYPKSGHFTFGAWFLTPFWRHFDTHRFLQIHNYELEARYYIKKAVDNAYYRGLYFALALDANKYAIGFNNRDGWQGEGLGGQVVVGYVLPLDKYKAWKLHFSVGAGYYMTNYDPYLYGIPDYFGHYEDGLYYYDTNLYRKEFKRRQHRFTWMGPTQLGISISYDLLWRKPGGGISFKKQGYKLTPKQ